MSNSETFCIDCALCQVRSPSACGECVVTALVGEPQTGHIEVERCELDAMAELARSGLVSPLRLVVLDGADRFKTADAS
jgi:hypothetical protein